MRVAIYHAQQEVGAHVKLQRRSAREAEVVLTPLIDVVFLLLIFFMLTTTFLRHNALQLELPEAKGESSPGTESYLEIMISATGTYTINGEPAPGREIDALMQAIRTVAADDRELLVVISADARAIHQDVIRAIDAAGRLGFQRLSIQAVPPPPGN